MPALSTILPKSGTDFAPLTNGEKRTVIVLGAARGGTSMVAGLVRMLGVFMGDRIESASNEDLDFIEGKEPLPAIPNPKHPEHKKVLETLMALVQKRNAEHDIWGWKDPLAFTYVVPLISLLPNPHFVVVYRDLYSISARELMETGVDTLSTLERGQRNYAWLLEVLKRGDAPALLAGYEKILRKPMQYASELAHFLGLPASDEYLQAVLRYVQPERGHGRLDTMPSTQDA